MRTITIHAPVRAGQTVTFSWSEDPPSGLYRTEQFELAFPPEVDLAAVPDALWWRVAMLCLHPQWPLLRPCRVVLPVRLPPGEREFWARMCDASVATLEGHRGGTDVERTVDIVECGPPLEAGEPIAIDGSAHAAVACFSGGRDSLTQTALLQELGSEPLLVSVDAPQPDHFEYATDRHHEVMREITRRRGVELVQVTTDLRRCWDNRFAWERYEAAVSELTDAFLYFAAALVVAAARGIGSVYLASEAEVQNSVEIGGQIVRHKHAMYSASTQRALSALLAPFGVHYSGLTYPLRQFQVQRLLNTRFADLSDLQYSCWSMTADQSACSYCGECRNNAFNLMANGRAPSEIGIDVLKIFQFATDWQPRLERREETLPTGGWASDMQTVRCLDAVTPERARDLVVQAGGDPLDGAGPILDAYARMRERALTYGVEPEPGYRVGLLPLLDPRLRPGLEAIFDEHFARGTAESDGGMLHRALALSDWIAAPLADPQLDWRPTRRKPAPVIDRHVVATPPPRARYAPEEMAALGDLLPAPEPKLSVNGDDPLRVATTKLTGNELRYLTECVETNWVSSTGRFVTRLEREFAEISGCAHGVACSSGTAALQLAVAAAGIGPGDEVIVPTFTMVACANVISHLGATPVFVDADPGTWNLDPDRIREAIGPRTRAILMVHIYGHPADADAIRALAVPNGLAVIEDAAEAHGATYHGRPAGSLGTIAAFSLYGNKILTTGEGGMVTTDDADLAALARELRDHGFSPERHFWHGYRAYNFRMTNLQAAVGVAQVERLDELLGLRRRMAALYRDALGAIPGLTLPPTEPGIDGANWMFGVVVGDELGITRDELREALAARGIETRTFFVPLHIQPAYRESQLGRSFPVAEWLGRAGLYLPSGPDIDEEAVARVAGAFTDARAHAVVTPRSSRS